MLEHYLNEILITLGAGTAGSYFIFKNKPEKNLQDLVKWLNKKGINNIQNLSLTQIEQIIQSKNVEVKWHAR